MTADHDWTPWCFEGEGLEGYGELRSCRVCDATEGRLQPYPKDWWLRLGGDSEQWRVYMSLRPWEHSAP